jgi:hypothetical protein
MLFSGPDAKSTSHICTETQFDQVLLLAALWQLPTFKLEQHTNQRSCPASPQVTPSYNYLRHVIWRTWCKIHQRLPDQNTV